MKTQTIKFLKTAFLTFISSSIIYGQKMPTLVIAGVESKNTELNKESIADLFLIEFKKLNLFDIYNKYDARQTAENNQINLQECFSKTCMIDAGNALKVDKVVSGQLEKFNNKIYINVRQIDISSGSVEKNYSLEFLSIEKEIQLMIELTLRKMYGLDYDEQRMLQLTTVQVLESTVNNPEITRLNLSGPRFGFGYISGRDGKSFQRPQNRGGFDATPVISHFGYQFEVAYLNQGNIQGLFEFVPNVSAIEHGAFIPSITILHGVRSNKSGLEFSVGPMIVLSRRSEGFFDDGGSWIRLKDYKQPLTPEIQNKITKELDRKGEFLVEGGLVLALGKSIRSGKVNFPFNVFAVLKKDSPRFGFSMGFNTKK